MKGTTSEFERRVCGRQRPYDYAVQPDCKISRSSSSQSGYAVPRLRSSA